MGRAFLDILHAVDISEGGVAIKVPHLFVGCRLEDDVELIVTLPGDRPFLARARIRHLQRAHNFFGVQFTELQRADLERIKLYIARRSAQDDSECPVHEYEVQP